SVLLPEHGADPMDYDVLVSFATLPREVTPDGKRITGQVSVLGSYARRVGYGIPTTLVGPNQDYPGTSLPGYFDEKEKIFDHVVLHELGHVLGLPHEHQNPLWKGRPALIADEEVIKEKLHAIRGRFRTEFDPQVDQEIRKLWPGVQDGDAIQFSDWQPLEVPPGKFLEDYTVMAHPFWSALLREPPEGAQELKLRTHPSDKDFARLRHMYGQR
ncbi:MAG TPA: hypothetical protein VJR89_06290, partial [Polyangiales bacterium]|nr:hypothetical protein [Polyangiales bacterium]